MTIKISELANLTVTQANTIVPVVSNVTGTLTTVQANVQQLQTYMLENAGNLIPRAGNIYSIGNSTTWWKDLWLSANTLYIGGVPMGTSGGSLTFGGNVVGTSDLPSYTGPVSANAVSVGATTVFGNITTLPTMSIDGDTGNVTASDISTTGSLLTGGDITTTGDISTTGAVTTGDVSFALSPAGAVNVLGFTGVSGTLYTPGRIYETTTDGVGSGLRVLVTYVEYGPGSARSLPSPSGGTIKIIDGGSGYSDGDVVYVQHYGDEQGGITATLQAQSVTGAPVTSGTITANTSVWSFDESGDTTVPGDVLLPDNTAIYNEDASTAVFTSNIISDATSIYLTDTGNAAVYASDYIVLETNSDGNVTQQWAFNQNGNIRFPDATTQSTAFSNTAPIITTLNNNITQANVGMVGYVNNSTSTANVGMKGYVDSQSFYSNAKVNTYLPTYSGNIGATTVNGNLTVFGLANIGFPSPISYGNIIVNAVNDANSYVQLNIQNINTVGNLVSADFIATAPNGTDTSKYIDMGINGNNFSSSSWTVSGKNDGYVYINSGNLTLGTDTPNTTVKVHVGGTLAGNVVTTFANTGLTITGNVIPSANVIYSLGSITNQWKELWVGNSTIYIGGIPISLTNQNGLDIDGNTIVTGEAYEKVRLGMYAGGLNGGGGAGGPQGIKSVAIGCSAGKMYQGANAVAVGSSAGGEYQGNGAVAIGGGAGIGQQGANAVSIGSYVNQTSPYFRGQQSQGNSAVSIGLYAGATSQGDNAVAIGAFAGQTNQVANSIAINASGATLYANAAGLHISPVRSDSGNISQIVYYNTTTKEVTYSSTANISGAVTIGGNLIVSNTYVPTANNSAGTAGQIAWDSGYVYICIATNNWKRANISTW